MNKIILIVMFFMGILTGSLVFSISLVAANFDSNKEKIIVSAPTPTLTPTPTPTPTPTLNPPERMIIEKLGIDTVIEPVGLDEEGKMDVPKNPDNVGWFEPGFLPGENGGAVMAGHLDKVTGAPAIFYTLNQLKVGDKISVIDKADKELVFEVVKTKVYDYYDFPSEEIFGSGQEPLLNLITCQGIWDIGTRNYSSRLVVSAKLVSNPLF